MTQVEKFLTAVVRKDLTTARNKQNSKQQGSLKKWTENLTLMKVQEEMTSKYKYLEEGKLKAAAKGTEPDLSAQKIAILSWHPDIK